MEPEKETLTQEVGQEAPNSGAPQEGVKEEGKAMDPEAMARELEAARQRLEALERELKATRDEAAKRRVEKKTLEERLAELEAAWQKAQERALEAEVKARLMAQLGDETAAEAALKLAKADGLFRVEGEEPKVDLEALFQRYPILRRATTKAPVDAGANPPSSGKAQPTSLAEAIRLMLLK